MLCFFVVSTMESRSRKASAPWSERNVPEFFILILAFLIPLSARLYQHLDNFIENEIRPITLGRKNYLFCGNHEAAQNMAVVCSLLATCRNHDVNPRLYLNDVVSQMPYHTKASHEELLQLLPHKWKLTHQESVMTNTI